MAKTTAPIRGEVMLPLEFLALQQKYAPLLTDGELADMYGCSKPTVRRIVKSDPNLAPIKMGAMVRHVRDLHLQKMARSRTNEPIEARQRKDIRAKRTRTPLLIKNSD